jgi:hypothetical protein
MISYFLAESTIPSVTGYVARVPMGNHLSATNIMNEVAQRTGMSIATIQSVFTAYQVELVKSLVRGESPEIGDLGYLITSLRGTFTSPLNVITAQNADLQITIIPARSLVHQVRAQATFQKITAPTRQPTITAIFDVTSTQSNVFTPGGLLRIVGDDLDFVPDSPTEGVFLSYEDPERGIIQITRFGRTGKKLVEFTIGKDVFAASGNPTIMPGGLTVTVKASYGRKSGELSVKEYSSPLYRAPLVGQSVSLRDFTGPTGIAYLKIAKDGTSANAKLAYQAPGAAGFGTAQVIAQTGSNQYTLLGVNEAHSLTVLVAGEAFYQAAEVQGVIATGTPVDVWLDVY